MIRKFFQKRIDQVEKSGSNSDLALRLMFEIAISDGSLDKSELQLIKKRAIKNSFRRCSCYHQLLKKLLMRLKNRLHSILQ